MKDNKKYFSPEIEIFKNLPNDVIMVSELDPDNIFYDNY